MTSTDSVIVLNDTIDIEPTNGLMAYFGYGSLVNLNSLRTRYIAAYPVRLRGWRRHWQSRPSGDDTALGLRAALLSVHRHGDLNSHIDGMLIIDRLENLPDLDAREAHYQRIALGDDLTGHDHIPGLPDVAPQNRFVYVALDNPQDRSPLLQSYLDVVLSGFYSMRGEEGVRDFIASTIGFERSIIADRQEPHYPRAVTVDEDLANWFDDLLRQARGSICMTNWFFTGIGQRHCL